jgi:hypothetical protein
MIDDDLQFGAELWNAQGGLERLLSRSSPATMTCSAFEAAVKEFPKKAISLRQGTRMIREHNGYPSPSTNERHEPAPHGAMK